MDIDPKNGEFPSFESKWFCAINCMNNGKGSGWVSIAAPSLPPKALHEQDKFKHNRSRHHPGDLAHVALETDQSGPSIVHGVNLLQLTQMCNPVTVRPDDADQDKPINFGYSDRRCTAIGARAFRDRKAKVYHYAL